MTYQIKYTLRNDTMFRTFVQCDGEIKDTETLRNAVAQAHGYDFNNSISVIDIISFEIVKS